MITSRASLSRSSTRALRTCHTQFRNKDIYQIPSRPFSSTLSLNIQKNAIVEIPDIDAYGNRIERKNLFSTAAAEIVDDTEVTRKAKKKLRRRLKLDAITVTKNAADRIKELLKGEGAKGAIGIRLGVKRRGCNGLSYTMNYATEKPPNDEEVISHGVHVFIEPMALLNVVGTTMDYEDTEMSSEFTFKNPNSKGECGCGESFNV